MRSSQMCRLDPSHKLDRRTGSLTPYRRGKRQARNEAGFFRRAASALCMLAI